MHSIFFRFAILALLLCTFRPAQAQSGCDALHLLINSRTNQFKGQAGEEISKEENEIHYRSVVNLPGFDRSYFVKENPEDEPVFVAKTVGFSSLQDAGRALDSLLQTLAPCMRGYSFYKEENCEKGCRYYITKGEEKTVLATASYFEETDHGWSAAELRITPAENPLPENLLLLTHVAPPLQMPENPDDPCEVLKTYVAAAATDFSDLATPDGKSKLEFPEAVSTQLTDEPGLHILLAEQTGDEDMDIDEAYLITERMLSQCLPGWNRYEVERTDETDFMNDIMLVKENISVQLKHELKDGGKGHNQLFLNVIVQHH